MELKTSVWFKTTMVTETSVLDDGKNYECKGTIMQSRILKENNIEQRREFSLKIIDRHEDMAVINVLQALYGFVADSEKDWEAIQ
jgi:hypothetical protein